MAGFIQALAVSDTKRMGLRQCPAPASTLWLANEERVEDILRRLKAVALQLDDTASEPMVVRGKDAGFPSATMKITYMRLGRLGEARDVYTRSKNCVNSASRQIAKPAPNWDGRK